MINVTLYKKIVAVLILCIVGAIPSVTHAFVSGDLEVQFQGGATLFSDLNIAPGFSTSRTVLVTNHGAQTQAVYTSVANQTTTGLDDVMHLSITATSTGTTYFDDSFHTLFNAADPVYLGDLSAGASREYTYGASMGTAVGNAYQGLSMGFDLTVGFEGGSSITTPSGGGGGTGSGGGGSSISLTQQPQGQVAGASTSTTPTSIPSNIITPVVNLWHSMVKGASTSTDTTSSASQSATSSVPELGNGLSTTTANEVQNSIQDQATCTLLWLLLLVAISFSWSIYDDMLRKSETPLRTLFIRNSIFSVVYVVLILLGNLFGVLTSFWWLFALAWAVMTSFDYWSHKTMLREWNPRMRNGYFAGISFVALLIALLTPLLCVWMPFAAIALISVVLLFFNE